jgi:plasmid replication initiation protein
MEVTKEIRQANALTNARYSYTELQCDLMFFIISSLKPDNKKSYSLDIRELSKLTGKKYNGPYLKKATADMGSRVFLVETETSYKQIWMFQQIEYLTGQGIIEFDLTERILPYLFDLKKKYTTLELAAALRLSSKYAKRLYPLCSQWKNLGETKKSTIEDFKKMLGLIDENGNEKMRQINELKAKVLDIAVKQINEHTELNISYKLGKKGRAYHDIVFTIKTQALAETIPYTLESTTQTHPEVSQFQYDNAVRILDDLRIIDPNHRRTILASPDHIRAVNHFNSDLQRDKVKPSKNAGGLLLTILGLVKPKPKST